MFKYRILYCLFFSAAILFYIFFNGYLSFFTLVFIVLLPIVSLIFLLLSIWKTTVFLEAETLLVNKNKDFKVKIKLKNNMIFPIAGAKIRFSYKNILSHDCKRETIFLPINSLNEQIIEYSMRSKYSGKMEIRLTEIKYFDYLGIFSVKNEPNKKFDVFVVPNIYYINAEINKHVKTNFDNSIYSKEKPGNDPSEIFDIRPYRSGDRLRNIHWKLSSKLDELMVKENSQPLYQDVLLMLELSAPNMETIDAVIEAFASLSKYLFINNIKHSVFWFNSLNNQWEYKKISSDEDLPLLLNQILSGSFSRNGISLLNFINDYKTKINFTNSIYITGQLSDELTEFCGNTDKTTVLYIEENDRQKDYIENLELMKVNIIKVKIGKVQESLDGVTL